jgi:hypothetical protein
VLEALAKGQVMPGESVPFCSTIYDNHLSTLSAHLSILERNSLHVIYSSLGIVDSTMKTAVESVMRAVDSETFKDVVGLERTKLQDLDKVMNVTEELIQKHLTKAPVDVLHLAIPYEKIRGEL